MASKKKRKKAAKPKRGYAGGQSVIVQELTYAGDGNYRDAPAGDSAGAVDKFTFNPENKTVFGHGDCGDARYIATNEEEAQSIIDFLKSCYGIK